MGAGNRGAENWRDVWVRSPEYPGKGSDCKLIFKEACFGVNGEFFTLVCFHMADDAGVDPEGGGHADNAECGGLIGIDFHPVAHVEDPVHLLPAGSRFFPDDPEQGGTGNRWSLTTWTFSTKFSTLVWAPPEQWMIPLMVWRVSARMLLMTGA